jgi:hypothetical protein
MHAKSRTVLSAACILGLMMVIKFVSAPAATDEDAG